MVVFDARVASKDENLSIECLHEFLATAMLPLVRVTYLRLLQYWDDVGLQLDGRFLATSWPLGPAHRVLSLVCFCYLRVIEGLGWACF